MRLGILVGVLVVVSGAAITLTVANREADDEAQANRARARVQIKAELFEDQNVEPTFGGGELLASQLCTQSQFASPTFQRWRVELREEPRYHNKLWEYVYILQALDERGMLQHGKKGLGFGVGREPLPSVMATRRVDVLATDLDVEQATKLGWVKGNQHMSSIDVLNARGLATEEQIRNHIKVMNVDMNRIPADLRGFDFAWSTCALGHLGDLEKGLAFIENSLETLRPGGIAVHTTEFNLTSNTHTYETENTSVYRRQDIERLAQKLTAQGHEVRLNLNIGNGLLDAFVDEQMNTASDVPHLRLRLGRYAVTSLGLVIRKKPD